MPPESFSILSLGFILGLRHALDADHLIAIATIVSEKRKLLSSSVVGILWGTGHTTSLLLVGFLVVFLKVELPPDVALAMEFAVAAMLVFLGLNVLWKVIKGEVVHIHVHDHHGHTHIHPHIHATHTDHNHVADESHHATTHTPLMTRLLAQVTQNTRPLLVGMVHGLAGSAALMLIILTTIASTQLAVFYIIIFGVGSILGMVLMSTVVSVPFVVAAKRSHTLQLVVRTVAGLASIGFGLFLGWKIGFVEGLFV